MLLNKVRKIISQCRDLPRYAIKDLDNRVLTLGNLTPRVFGRLVKTSLWITYNF
jgi:hypothetical protein